MTQQLAIDFERAAGNAGRDAGMRVAADHAEDIQPGWTDRAYALLCEYIATKPAPFTSPEFRRIAASRGLSSPASNMAWGSVFMRASKAGLIERNGYVQHGDTTMHTQAVAQWRVSR